MNWKKWISIAAAVCLAVTAVPMRAVAQEELLQEKMLEEIKEEQQEEIKEELKEEPKEEKEEKEELKEEKEEKEEKEKLQEQSDEKTEPQEESKKELPKGISLLMGEENSTAVSENEAADFEGEGTVANPYKIQNVEDLKKLAKKVNSGTTYERTYFKLTANIDLNNEPWTPIGKSRLPFQGTFDGDGHQITNFKVAEPNKYVGLFGYAQYAVIKNCSVTGEINGHSNEGYNQYNYAGGIVGYTGGSTQILNCSFRGNVTGASEKVGGIVGEISGGSKVSGCYVIGNIAGNNDQGVEGRNGVGGIIGINDKGTIENCVSLAESVTGGNVNRIAGRITGGKLTNNYAWSGTKVNSDTVSADDGTGSNGADLTYAGGTLSPQFSEIFGEDNSAWKFTDNGLPILKDVGGTQSAYLPPYLTGEGFYGKGTEKNPYEIRNADDLKLLAEKVNSGVTYEGKYFKQTADINLNNEPWTPIGTVINNGKDAKPFKGTFDGDGYKITNLKVTGNSNNAGLFGYTQDATIKNCNVTGEVKGFNDVGGIVGNADGKTQILSCSFRGDVTGEDSYIGGIAGSARGTIKNCYALADVTARIEIAGGIAGYAYHVTIENCYYSGNVPAGNSAGGIAGFVSGSIIKNCVSLAKSVTDGDCVNRIVGDVSRVENVTLTSNYGYNRTKLVVYGKEGYADIDTTDVKQGTTVFVSKGKLMTDVQKNEAFDWNGFDTTIWSIPTEAYKLPSLHGGEYPDLPNLPSKDLTIGTTPQHFTTRNIGNGFVVKVLSPTEDIGNTPFEVQYRLHDTDAWTSAVPNTAGTYDVKITRAADGDINPFACEISEGLVLTKKRSSSSGTTTRTYTAQFDTNGGSAVGKVKTDKNGKIERPADPTKEGYIFVGWYSDSKLTKPFDFSAELTANSTLYAKWKENNEIILTIGSRKISVFGREIKNDVAPKIVNDRTMLPIRIVAESLGGTVTWNGELQRVTIQKGADVILITIGADTAYVNGTAVKLDAAAFVENGRTYLPLRFVSETLGAQVAWNEAEKTVTITK